MLTALLPWCQQATAQDWIDVTDTYLTNPKFDNGGDGWSLDGWGGSFGAVNYGCMEVWNGVFALTQQLNGLPPGHFRLSVQAYYRTGNFSMDAYEAYTGGTEEINASLFASSDNIYATSPIVSVYSTSVARQSTGGWWDIDRQKYFPNNMEAADVCFNRHSLYWNEVEFDFEGGDLTIGIDNWDYIESNWCIWDNFKLEFKGQAVSVQSVSVSAEHTTMVEGETQQLTATVLPENALNKRVRWTSSSTATATVDQNGVVTALAPGTVTITAQAQDGTGKLGSIGLTIERNEVKAGSLVINEIMASNVDEFISPAFNFDGFIELYNPTAQGVLISSLVVSTAKGEQWAIPAGAGVVPAGGYRVLWFDSNDLHPYNTPFKLDVDGGTVTIATADGTVVDSQTYPASLERVSYARTTDGGDTWGLAAKGTPGTSNSETTFAQTQLAAPVVDQPSQLFSGHLSVNVTIPSGCTLRYTTDGSVPTLDNGETSSGGQFAVSETAVYRFRLFADGMLPSTVTSRSYIYKDREYYLPVVSVVTPWDYLYDSEIGVMTTGPNGRPGNGRKENCNWNMNWERPVNFSYLDSNGEMVLNQDVNLEMCGGWSRAWTPHSFKLKGNKELGGEKNLPYTFFSQKPYIRNRTLQIRNGGNDTQCRFKDPAIATIVQTSGMDIDVQAYQPIHEFINGQYIGVLNVREPNNKHYVYANYGWDDDEIDQWEMSPDSGYVQKCGTPDAYVQLVDELSPSAANPETYQEICQLLDIDEFTNYMATQFFLGGSDWPRNNVKAFRLRDGGKFRFVLFDTDAAFDYGTDVFQQFLNKETWTFDELYPQGTGRITDQIRLVTLFRNLLQNDGFRRKFIDAYSLVSGSVFEASRAQQICDELYQRVQPAMQLNGGSAAGTYNTVRNRLGSRLSTATNAIRNYDDMGLGGQEPQRVRLDSNADGAQLEVNGQQVPTGRFDGNLFAPVKVRALAPAGYQFQGWVSSGTEGGTTLKGMGEAWQYYDQGSLDGQNWTSPTFNSSSWPTGNAPLGYSSNQTMATVLDYGGDSSNKRPTYYFRTSVQIDETPSDNDQFALSYNVDDGFVVYVNGSEAARFNMPSGSVNYSTFASTYADQFPTGTVELPASLFHKGSNVVAVEVHNNAANSTDIFWNASITAQLSGSSQANYYSTQAEIALPKGNGLHLTASYSELSDNERLKQGVTPVRINEVSGANGSYINEYGKKDDWVELYNTTSEPIDVEGMFLSNDEANAEMYQITKGSTQANTIIPAHGYLLVWCSKRETTSQGLHASFKVSAQGGTLLLTAADRSWQDKMLFPAHDANHTVARYPDGCADVFATNVATIAKANLLSSYVEQVQQDDPTAIRTTMLASANGFRIRYGKEVLLVKSDDDGLSTVDIFTTDGRLLERHTVRISGGTGRLSVAHLPQGFYVARATGDGDNRVGCKFVR